MKKNLLISVSSLLTISLLSSCGDTSSNPLDKYKNLKSGPVHDEKPVTQQTVRPDLFTVQIEGTHEQNNGNFVEGQESELLIKVTPRAKSITHYSVQLADFTNVNRPELTETNIKGIYSLRWTPPVGTIPGGNWGKTFQAKLEMIVLEAGSDSLKGTAGTKTLDIVVSRNNEQPKITGRTDLSKGVEEGQPVEFSVDVVDPGSVSSPKVPEIQITPYMYSNTEAYRADASRYLVLDDKREENPKKMSAGIYRFYYNMYVDNLPLDRDRLGREVPSASEVDLCFHMRAVSVVGTLSDQLQVCTKARYAAQPPVITMPEVSEVKAGVATTLSVKISSEHAQSVITIQNPSRLISELKGEKSVSCDFDTPEKKNSQTCVITWTPACISKTEETAIKVKADSYLGKKMKSSEMTKSISVVADLEACPVAKPSVKAKPPVKESTKGNK